MSPCAVRAVFLDRDGVINRAVIRGTASRTRRQSLQELEILPGVARGARSAARRRVPERRGDQPARRRNRQAATRGRRGDASAARASELPIDAIKVCFHGDADRLRVPQAQAGNALRGGAGAWTSISRAASWSATGGATSPPGKAAGCCTFLHRLRLRRKRCRDAPYRRGQIAGGSRSRYILASTNQREHYKGFQAMSDISKLKVKLFADGADLAGIKEMAANPMIKGFTTNPTLMRKAGVADYKAFALRGAQGDPRPAGFVRGLRRRLRQDGEAGARDRFLGQERQREDSGHEHEARVLRPAHRAPVQSGRTAERDRVADARAGEARHRTPRPGDPGDHLGLRRAHRRHRARSGADHGRGRDAS